MNWINTSQKELGQALKHLENYLQEYVYTTQDTCQVPISKPLHFPNIENSNNGNYSSAIQALYHSLGLSSYELKILLLVAAPEICDRFVSLLGQAHNNSEANYPTFQLTENLFACGNVRWATSPDASLRRWELITLKDNPTWEQFRPLYIKRDILDYLLGYSYLDKRLESYVHLVKSESNPLTVTKTYQAIAKDIVKAYSTPPPNGEIPLIQLCGCSPKVKLSILANACQDMNLSLYSLSAGILPSKPEELSRISRLWIREAILKDRFLLIDCEELNPQNQTQWQTLIEFLATLDVPIALSTRELLPIDNRYYISLDVPLPSVGEQHQLWQLHLGSVLSHLNGSIDGLVANFQLTPDQIADTSNTALTRANNPYELQQILWETCRSKARPKLNKLATKLEPKATWADLILPQDRQELLREMINQIRYRTQVYERWGFANKSGRGFGVSALFAGTSGTGKTMAAEVIAAELNLDLYRIDLSTVVSKYIGDTEKNLSRLFDAAENGGVILLFDEGDALFGKRTEASDSKDKYANMEVSYLLQRLEAYRGMAIITTNIEDSLDSAFVRRLRYIINFPFPGPEQRAEIWQRILPADKLDTSNPYTYKMLAQMQVSGGLIRSIALKAAFFAAETNSDKIDLNHIYRAAKSEYSKIKRTLSASETPWIKP